MLKAVEPSFEKEGKAVMLVEPFDSKKSSKNKKKSTKAKGGMDKKKAKEIAPKGTCFHYSKSGHRRRNCKAYLESLKKASNAPSTSDMFVIEVNIFSHDNLWVLDTSCGSHIFMDVQGLRNNMRLNKGESD